VFFSFCSNGYGKQVPVLFDVSPGLADRIITDEEWLWQMILNFLTNACKYTDRGDIMVVLSRKPSSAAEPEMLLVEVADTGKTRVFTFPVYFLASLL